MAVNLLLLLFLVGLAFGGPIITSGQGVEIQVVGPLEDGRVVFQRIARPKISGAEQGRISIALSIVNKSPSAASVEKIRILGQDVTSFGTPRVVNAGSSRRFQNAVCPAPKLPDLPDPDCFETKPLVIDSPFPTSATIEVYLTGFDVPLQKVVSLAPHTNDGGPLSWVGKASDLRPNETWGALSDHDSDHQVFALDAGVLGWNGKAWTEPFVAEKKELKEDYRAYGMPVYALADGKVCGALNDHEERPTIADATTISPSVGSHVGGGNQIFVRAKDEIYVVAHLQRGSIPAELLIPGTPVKKGQYLGKVGLSGDTGHPHTHIHVKKEPGQGDPTPTDACDAGEFRPMTFQDMQSLTLAEANTLAAQDQLDPGDWMQLTNHSAPHPYGLLYPASDDYSFCPDCTDSKQYIGVWRAGDHIELRVKAPNWEAFTAKWDELSNDSFRLVEINTFEENDSRQYLGLFQRGGGAHALWNGAGWDEFTKVWSDLSKKGLRLVDVDTYLSGKQRFYIGVFRQGRDDHYLWSITGWDAFTQKWEELGKKDLRLVDLETFDLGGGQRQYIGVWRAGADGHALWSTTGWDAFIAKWTQLAADNLRLIDIETFAVGGSRQFIGVFREGRDPYVLESVTGYDKFVQASEKHRYEGLRLVDIHVEP